MDHLTLWFTIVLMCCVSTRLSLCELFHPEQTENMTDRTNCTLAFVNRTQIDDIKKYIDDGNRLIRFKLNILGDVGPLGEKNLDGLLRPDRWILSTAGSGKALLFLPEDYIQKSIWTLSFSEKNIEITLSQKPDNCFGADNRNYTLQEIKNTIRYHLLKNFSFANDEMSENFEFCNLQIITATDNKSADLKYICCSEIDNMCKTLKSSTWMDVLVTCLSLVKYCFAPLFSPLLIPKSFYKKSSFLFRYSTKKISQPPLVLRIRKTDQQKTNGFIKLAENLKLQEFKNKLKHLPNGDHILNINSINIEADLENLVECGTSPVTFPTFIMNYFGRCMMRNDDKYMDSCCYNCPSNIWFDYVRFTVAFIFLLSPWWIIIVFFYIYDNEFYNEVNNAENDLGLDISVSNNIDVLTPEYFLFQGIIFASFFVVICCKFKSRFYVQIFHRIMSQKNDIVDILTLSEKALSKVRKQLKWGCLYFFVWSVLKLVHLLVNNIPFLQFNWKVFTFCMFIRRDAKKSSNDKQQYCDSEVISLLKFYFFFCFLLLVLCIYVLPIYIEIFVLTITGIMLNFNDTFKYAMMIFVILVYGHQCFSTNVSSRYLSYAKSLVQYILKKNKDQMFANENDFKQDDNDDGTNMQENQSRRQENDELDGFAYMTPSVSCTQQKFEILRIADSENQQMIWNAPSLLLFHDISKNNFCSYIPAEFFNKMNLLPKNLCPGIPTALYLKALREFVLGILFVSFLFIAVFALGRVQELSASVQTIVAVGTGLLPLGVNTFLLKSKATNLSKIERDHFWQIMFDETAKSFNEHLIISDIDMTEVITQGESVPYSDGVNTIQSARGSNEGPVSTISNNENISSTIDFVVIKSEYECIIYVREDMVTYEKTEYPDGYQKIY